PGRAKWRTCAGHTKRRTAPMGGTPPQPPYPLQAQRTDGVTKRSYNGPCGSSGIRGSSARGKRPDLNGDLMKKTDSSEDELRPEYDLHSLRVRRLGPGRQRFGEVVRLAP